MESIKNYKSCTLQVLLAITAFFSWIETRSIGNRYISEMGVFQPIPGRRYEGTSLEITSGFIGGALSMGFICCVCIVMIVWLEIEKKKK